MTDTYDHSNEESTRSVIYCHPYDWTIQEEKNPDGFITIECWALGKICKESDKSLEEMKSKDLNFDDRILIRIENFNPSLMVLLPETIDDIPIDWTSQSKKFVEKLNFFLKRDKHEVVGYSLQRRKNLYFYSKNDCNFLKLRFRNKESLDHCSRVLGKEMKMPTFTHKFLFYEDKIDITRKLLTKVDVLFSGWFKCIGEEEEYPIGNGKVREFNVNFNTIKPIDNNISKSWFTFPRIVSFDIETYSPNHLSLPSRQEVGNDVYIISCICQDTRPSEKNKKQRIALVSANCNFPQNADKLIICKDEADILTKFCDVINEFDPEIITGYNILGYDIPYMEARMKRLKIKGVSWKNMSRLYDYDTEVKEISWSSSGAGINDLQYFYIPGRICIDMMLVVKRDYKFPKYTLDYVSYEFLKDTKHDMKAKRMFEIYKEQKDCEKLIELFKKENNIKDNDDYKLPAELNIRWESAVKDMTDVVAYALQDGDLVVRLFEKLNVWIALIQLSCILGVPPVQLFTRGQGVRYVSQMYHLAHKQNYVMVSRKSDISEFQGATVYDPIPGYYEGVICLDFSSLYPSIIIAYNICMSTFIEPKNWDRFDPNDCNIIKFDQEIPDPSDEKAQAQSVEKKKKNNFEFSEFTDGNSSESDSDDEPEGQQDESGVDAGVPNKRKKKEVKMIKITKEYRFIKETIKKGLLPMLVENLVGERKNVRKNLEGIQDGELQEAETLKEIWEENGKDKYILDVIEKEKKGLSNGLELYEHLVKINHDILSKLNPNSIEKLKKVVFYKNENNELLKVILDKRQLALKISANSCYGALGASTSSYSLLEGAESVTATGRQLLKKGAEFITGKYPEKKVLYEDTDSIFVLCPGVPREQINDYGKALGVEVSKIFKKPLKMEFEKAGNFLFIKKKKYIGYIIDENSKTGEFKKDKKTGKNYMFERGIVLQRRDTSKILRDCYSELAHNILSNKPISEGFKIVTRYLNKFLSDSFDIKELAIIKTYNATKSATYSMNVFGEWLKTQGLEMAPGSRLEYVIVEHPDPKEKVGRKMRLLEQMMSENNTDKIDIQYYIEKTLINPIDQLFDVGYIKYRQLLSSYGYVKFNNIAKGNAKVSKHGLNKPVALVCAVFKDFSKKGLVVDKCMLPRQLKKFIDVLNEKHLEFFYQVDKYIESKSDEFTYDKDKENIFYEKSENIITESLPTDIKKIHNMLKDFKENDKKKYNALMTLYNEYFEFDDDVKEKYFDRYKALSKYFDYMNNNVDLKIMKHIITSTL